MTHPDFTMRKKGEVVGVFSDYIRDYYMIKGSLWARFGRLDSDVSCNMHLESFHRTLKKRYLKRVANQRLDFLIHRLIHRAAPDFFHKLQRSVLMAYFIGGIGITIPIPVLFPCPRLFIFFPTLISDFSESLSLVAICSCHI